MQFIRPGYLAERQKIRCELEHSTYKMDLHSRKISVSFTCHSSCEQCPHMHVPCVYPLLSWAVSLHFLSCRFPCKRCPSRHFVCRLVLVHVTSLSISDHSVSFSVFFRSPISSHIVSVFARHSQPKDFYERTWKGSSQRAVFVVGRRRFDAADARTCTIAVLNAKRRTGKHGIHSTTKTS